MHSSWQLPTNDNPVEVASWAPMIFSEGGLQGQTTRRSGAVAGPHFGMSLSYASRVGMLHDNERLYSTRPQGARLKCAWRTFMGLWNQAGLLLDTFTPDQCRNDLRHCGNC